MPGVFQFSQTASINSSACPTVNWAENQAPSSINDSARAEMAAVACYRDDISGMLVTTGSSAAYAITSNQGFDTLANFHNKAIYFTPHVTNAVGPVTLTVDGFANVPLRSSPGKELQAGVLVQGTPYGAIYNNTDGALYLMGFYGNPYNVPISAGFDYWGPTAPNSSFAFPIGQAISRTTYSSLFSGNPWSIGTTYGAGDGSTTFNLPDKTGRVSAMKEATGTRLTTAGGGVDGGTLGSAAGAQTEVIGQINLPNVNFTGNNTITVTSTSNDWREGGTNVLFSGGGISFIPQSATTNAVVSSGVNSISVPSGGSGTPLKTTQPTIICNYVIRII